MKYDLAHVSLHRSFQIWTLQCPLEAWIRFWRHLLVRHQTNPAHDHSSSRLPSPRWWNLMGWEKPFTCLFCTIQSCSYTRWFVEISNLIHVLKHSVIWQQEDIFFISFCFFLSDCRRETNSSRQSRQRRDHSNSLRRPQKPGRTRTTDCTTHTRSVGVFNTHKNKCTNYFDSSSFSFHILFTDLVSFSGGQRPFSDMRDDDSLFSKFFGGFK